VKNTDSGDNNFQRLSPQKTGRKLVSQVSATVSSGSKEIDESCQLITGVIVLGGSCPLPLLET